MKEEIIAGLDIGSTTIRLAVAQKINSPEGGEWQVIGAVSQPALGVNKGLINSIEDATSAISACLEKAERLIGIPVGSVWVSVNNARLRCEKSRGVAVVGKSDGEIDEADVERAIEAARSLAVPNNYEILHVIPTRFTIDNQEDIKDPIGMSGIRLEVETLIVLGLSNQMKNLVKTVHRTGLEIDGLAVAPLAAAEAVLDAKQKNLGVVLINIGATTTSLAVYEDGDIIHTAVLPLGSEHITSDVAIGLRCPINLAERIKIEYGSSEPGLFNKKDEIDIMPLARAEHINDNFAPVSCKYLAEIIEARVEEIFTKANEELKRIDRAGMLPAGAVLVGGGALLRDITETAKRVLRLPVSVSGPRNIKVAIDKAKAPEFITALGLIVWGLRFGANSGNSRLGGGFNDAVNKFSSAMQGIFKKILPR
jgi:cell division protein FtsA